MSFNVCDITDVNTLLSYYLPKDIIGMIAGYYTYFDLELMNKLLQLTDFNLTTSLFGYQEVTRNNYSLELFDNEYYNDGSTIVYPKVQDFYQLFKVRNLQPRDDNEFLQILERRQITCNTINKIVLVCSTHVELKDLDKYSQYSTYFDLNNIKDRTMKLVLAPENKYFTAYEIINAIRLVYTSITENNSTIIKDAFLIPRRNASNPKRVIMSTKVKIVDIVPQSQTLTIYLNDTQEYSIL